jgi:ribonuclease D
MTDSDICFIDSNEIFHDYCETLLSKKVIALDTEFLRVNTFYPKPGLFQIFDGEQIVLADPCVITRWDAFRQILVNPEIVKVFHACDEDIELLYHFLNVSPQAVFDTQVAAAFCAYDFCMGYQRLIKAALDIDLEKGHSRSDWMQRPLSQEQVHYAADDVRYLLPLYEKLSAEINAKQLGWVIDEEYQSVLATISSVDFDHAYTRVKEAWKLNKKQFSVLKALACWREMTMRDKDLPRKRIASDEALMTLAGRTHWTLPQLYEVEGLSGGTVKYHGAVILDIIARAVAQGGDEVMMKPVRGDKMFTEFKQLIEEQAKLFGVDEKMLSKKQFNEQVYWQMQAGNFEVPATITGWRRPLYQQALNLMQAGRH